MRVFTAMALIKKFGSFVLHYQTTIAKHFSVHSFQKTFSLFNESKSGKFGVFKNVYVFAIDLGS